LNRGVLEALCLHVEGPKTVRIECQAGLVFARVDRLAVAAGGSLALKVVARVAALRHEAAAREKASEKCDWP